MKNLKFAILLVLAFNKSYTQSSIVFSYDQAGNLIERKLQVSVGARLSNFKDETQVVDSLPPLNFKVYPNPTNTSINIEGDLPEGLTEAEFFILNTNGQRLKTGWYKGDVKNIDVSDLNSGIFFLEIIYSKKERMTYKIIVTN